MLADRLDESLLLFKNAYGWSTSDMVYVSLKVQTYAKAADSTKKRPSSSPPAGTNRSGDDAAPPPSSSAPPPPPDVLRSLGRLTALDRRVWDAAVGAHEAYVAAYPEAVFRQHLAAFVAEKTAYRVFCKAHREHQQCREMQMDNMQWSFRARSWFKRNPGEPFTMAAAEKVATSFKKNPPASAAAAKGGAGA